MIRAGVIGYGYWGPNLVRNFVETANIDVVAVCDARRERLQQVEKRYPKVKLETDPKAIIDNPAIDAVVIATPVNTHYPLALAALEAGKHVWVEKPLTASSPEGERLIEEAARRGLTLFVDHTFLFTPAVRKIRALRDEGQLGTIYYYDSVRVNLGLFQNDVNVIWDLAPHDLAIMDYVLGEMPVAVSATGMSHIEGRAENIAFLTFLFESKLIAHVHVNWLAPVKIRRTLIGASNKMVVYDDVEPSEKVRVYDKGIVLDNPSTQQMLRVSYRAGDVWTPHLENREALSVAAVEFARAIETGEQPVSGGIEGLRIVRMLEAACQSLSEHGRPVEIAAVNAPHSNDLLGPRRPTDIYTGSPRPGEAGRPILDSIRRLEDAISKHQDGDRHSGSSNARERSVHTGRGSDGV